MFGFFYSIFVLICKSILTIKEDIFLASDKKIAKKENKMLYHDMYGDLYLTSNNHKVNPFGVDIKTGDCGIKDIVTGELVYNASEQERIRDEKQKNDLIKENNEYNEVQRKKAIENNKYYYRGLDIDCYNQSNNHKYWYSKNVLKRTSDNLNIKVDYKTVYDEKNIFKLDILDSNTNNKENIKNHNSHVISDENGTFKLLGYSKEDLINYANKIGAIY